MRAIIYAGSNRIQITPVLPPEHFKVLRSKLSYQVPNVEFTNAYRNYGWDGLKCLLTKQQQAPLGCLYRTRSALKNLGYKVEIQFENASEATGKSTVCDLKLSDFQLKAVERAVKYRHCILEAPVRAGKTAIAGAIINRIGQTPVWVVSRGKDLVRQTKAALEGHLGRKVGIFSESKFEPSNIIVSSYQALSSAFGDKKYKKLSKKILDRNEAIKQAVHEAKILILDECHHAVAEQFPNVLKHFSSLNYQIGLSATPKPSNVPALQAEALLGAIVYKVSYAKLVEQKRLAQPIVCIYDLPLEWYASFLSEFADVYDANIVGNTQRNLFIAHLAKKVLSKGKSVYINVSRLAHGPILQELIPSSVFIYGDMKAEARQQIFQSLRNKELRCVVATVGKEGMNVPSLDVVINAEGQSGIVPTKQKMRSLTACEGKKVGVIIDFMDRGKFLKAHSKSRLKYYSSMPGFIIKRRKITKDFFGLEGHKWESLGARQAREN